MSYLAPELLDRGYVGATGTTPYRLSTSEQVANLREQYANALSGRNLSRSGENAIGININFDGTQKNREYVTDGESILSALFATIFKLMPSTPVRWSDVWVGAIVTVEVFDFARLVQQFDAARASNPGNNTAWAVMNGLLDAHLRGSDTAALGGDLSFQYATAGGLAGIGVAAAQAGLTAGSTDWQSLKPRPELEQGAVRLV